MKPIVLCLLLLASATHAQTWTRIAAENASFTVPPATTVRYGAGTAWVVRTLGGTGQCTNEFFGADPIKMTVKACEALVPAPVAPPPAPLVPACWPAQVAGSGTPARTAVVNPADAPVATPGASAPAGAEPVHVLWWHCPSALEPSGWKTTHLMCPQSKITACLLGVPTLNPTALAAAWKAAPPRPANEGGIGWAETAWRKLHGAPPPAPPAEAWIVAKAAANANPAGTRPAFILLPPATLVDLYATERVKEGDACDCAKASLVKSTTRYCQTGTRADKVAVCVKR